MKQTGNLLLASCIAIITLSACGQNSINKRWVQAGRLVQGKIYNSSPTLKEYEFLGNGTFNAYERGVVVQNANYVMASDKKSLVIQDARQSLPVRIVKLTGSELQMIFGTRQSGDTIVCYAAGSAADKAAHKQENALKEVQDKFYVLSNYERARGELLQSIVLKIQETEKNKKFADFIKLKENAETMAISFQDFKWIPRDKAIQDKVEEAAMEAVAYLKEHYPDMKEYSSDDKPFYIKASEMLAQINKNIQPARADFIKAVNEYNR